MDNFFPTSYAEELQKYCNNHTFENLSRLDGVVTPNLRDSHNENYIPYNGGAPPCTYAQLREAGYKLPPPLCPPEKDRIPERRTIYEQQIITYSPKITIRCLEPPPIPLRVSFI